MKKLDKELYIKHAKRLAVIINAQSPFAKYLTRPDFISGLKLQLNVLSGLEKKFPDEKLGDEFKAEKLAVVFSELSKTEFKLDPKFNYEDEADYIDAINYLYTFCKNIFKVDLDELAEGKKVELASPEINLGAEANADAGAAAGAGAFMGGMAGMEGMEAMMMNPFAYGKATEKLSGEVKAGNVYQYKTKPKALPIVKIILCCLVLFISLAFVVTTVFVFITNGLHITSLDGTTSVDKSFIADALFYLITAGFGIYVSVMNIKELVASKKNDNIKYGFNWFVYFGFILLTILIPLIDIKWMFPNNFNYIIADTTIKKTVGWAAWKILWYIDIIAGAITIIPIIIGGVKAPKVDQEKMQGLIQKYIGDFMASATPTAKPGVDVQKPVEVKPTEEKKEDKPGDKKPDDTPLKS